MNGIFETISDLKSVVKINASMPFESISPYINDAADIYLVPFIGESVLSTAASAEAGSRLKELVRRALGPLAMALATDELGVMYGDSGITVQNETGKRSPANDSKIQSAKENLMLRGMQALDRLLAYLRANIADYSEFAQIPSAASGCFIKDAVEYQDNGGVQIDYSSVSFRQLLPTLMQLQNSDIRPLFSEGLYGTLLANSGLNAKQSTLRSYIVLYLANRSAGLYTSQASTQQRAGSRVVPEFRALIRPIYSDQDSSTNFYLRQADFYMSQIKGIIEANAEELGLTVPDSGLMNYNSKENKFVTSIL